MAGKLNEDSLLDVFTYAVQSPVPSFGFPLSLHDVPILNLAAVCRSWRAIIMRYPILWSFIYITTPDYPRMGPTPMHPSFLLFVKTCLEKSNESLLSIWLDIHRLSNDRVCKDIVALLFSEYERWAEIYIYTSDADLGFSSPVTLRCSPNVSSVNLSLPYSWLLEENVYANVDLYVDLSPCTLSNERTARLTSLNISRPLKWSFSSRRETLHLPHLTTLRFFADLLHDFDSVLAILSASPNLACLHIHDRHTASLASPDRTRKSVILRHLVDLNISVVGARDIGSAALGLLDHLSCPSLLKCTFQALEHWKLVRPEYTRSFATFFSRDAPSPPPLVELKVHYPRYITFSTDVKREVYDEHLQALLELLRPLHRLERLRLWDPILNDRFIEELMAPKLQGGDSERRTDEILCPTLSELGIGWSSYTVYQISAGMVEEMLVSRAESGKRLTKFAVGTHGFGGFVDRSDQMKRLFKDGFEITFEDT